MMNADIKEAFTRIKPVCDVVMVCPTPESIASFMSRVVELTKEVVQELQQYVLFPLITHLTTKELRNKHEILSKLAEAMWTVLERVTVNNYEMCLRIETALLSIVFDKGKTGMVAEVPEELKLSVMRALTSLMLHIDTSVREQLLKSQIPLLAQAVFVAVHIAKMDRLRALRLSAISCVLAHTSTHESLTKGYSITDPIIEGLVVDMLSSILPGVLAALQDVATCKDNPGHAVIVAALNAIHRILCLTMNDKYIQEEVVTIHDFAQMIRDKTAGYSDVSDVKAPKALPKRSPEWFKMAGDKLAIVIKSLVSLSTHEHYKARKELAVLCHRLLTECSNTMHPSTPLALDVLISLTNDTYPEVSKLSSDAVNSHFNSESSETLDVLCNNFFATLNELPRILNNIDSARKLSTLNLIHGYIQLLCNNDRPQRLTQALSSLPRMCTLNDALSVAAKVLPATSLTQHATREVTSPPPLNSPWCKLQNLDSVECENRLKDICQLLGDAECAELILDWILDRFIHTRDCESACIVNWMGQAPKSSTSLVKRILNTYLEEDLWYSPLEMITEQPLTSDDTLDVTVYNPRAWDKDYVPDLYEGAVETRYTGISYTAPRTKPSSDPRYCNSLAEAQKNLVLCCLLTEGVGIMARRLGDEFQPYLLRSLVLILERVGSKYELLHLAGLKSINDIAKACSHTSVADLVQCNADYFTCQITTRLKKAWHCQSALHILTVVMEYSDQSILDCLYGIVEDVLVKSCDKYHEKDLHSYLQVFLTFIECIHKWFPNQNDTKRTESQNNIKNPTENKAQSQNNIENHTEITEQNNIDNPTKNRAQSLNNLEIDVLKDAIEYAKSTEEADRLLNEEECGKSAEDMFNEDQREREDTVLDYDDRVTEEILPLPQHIKVTCTIIKRSINFVSSKHQAESILALQVITKGLPILGDYEDELLPLVHQTWGPLVGRFGKEPAVLRRALELLVVMAELSKDFIRSRAVKEVLPQIFTFLKRSSSESYLKDVGSSYRTSQAFTMQTASLTALPTLVIELGLEDTMLEQAMDCVDEYLSRKQPRPLQDLAVTFFTSLLELDYGAVWYHLRKLCSNDQLIQPPDIPFVNLQPVVGTPYTASNKDYDANVRLVFNCKL